MLTLELEQGFSAIRSYRSRHCDTVTFFLAAVFLLTSAASPLHCYTQGVGRRVIPVHF